MNKNFFFRISGNGLFHVVFCQTFSRFLFLTLFCFLVAHIIFNQRSFCRIYPQKGGVFIFSNYVVVAPIFAADYLQNSTLPSAKYPWSICLFSIAKHCGISTTVQYLYYYWKKFFRNIHQMERKTTVSQINRTSSALPRSKTKRRLHTKQNMRIEDSRWCTYLADILQEEV